jgi:hypothetical protein
VDAAALPSLPRGEPATSTCSAPGCREDGIAYEVAIPPAGLVRGTEDSVTEMLTWVGRHVIRHVQAAFE